MRATDAPGWLSQRQADVPAGDEWLGAAEREVLAGLRVAPRRASWRLGRWTAKAALAAWLGVPGADIEVLAARDGAPEAWLRGARAPVSLSLSHRDDRALAVVADAPAVVGCDEARRALIANLIWTAKEAAAKVRREGLRLDVRAAVVTFAERGATADGWRPVHVDWGDGAPPTLGWWRAAAAFVMTIAAAPVCRAPGAALTPPATTPAASAAGPAPRPRAT